MKVKFFDPGKSYLAHKKEYDFEIQRVLKAGDLILRDDVLKFEENLAKFVGTKYAIATNSGTDAIYLALKALNIKGNVALPAHTFKSTCGAVINAGAIPVIYDMDKLFFYGANVKAHIPVHIAGEISLRQNFGIPVIEDACQAFGAVKNPTTSAQCWSFYPAKILGAYGDAGGLTTNDKNIYEYIKEARNHFKGLNEDFGINSRMDNLQACILNIKMKYINSFIERRQEIASMYYKGLQKLEENGKIKLPNKQKNRVYQDFILQVL